MLTYSIIAIGWFSGGIIGGAVGVGGVMLAIPICLFVIPPEQAIVSACLIGFIASFQVAYAYVKYARWHDLKDLLIGCIPGTFIGVFFLKFASVAFLQLMISAILTLFLTMQLSKKLAAFSVPDIFSVRFTGGLLSGFVASSVSMVGAPLGVYVLLNHWDPNRARANMYIFYSVSMVSSVFLQFYNGMIDENIIKFALSGIVGVFLGQAIGIKLGKRINIKLFRWLLIIFLGAVDIMLFARGIYAL